MNNQNVKPSLFLYALLIFLVSAAWYFLLDIHGVIEATGAPRIPFYGNAICLVVIAALCWRAISDPFLRQSIEVGTAITMAFMVPVQAFYSPKGIAPEFALQVHALGPIGFLVALGISIVLYLWWFRQSAPNVASAVGGGLIAGGLPVLFALPLLAYAMSFHGRLLDLTRYPGSSLTVGLVGMITDCGWFLLIFVVLSAFPFVLASLAWMKKAGEPVEPEVLSERELNSLMIFSFASMLGVGMVGVIWWIAFSSSIRSFESITPAVHGVTDIPVAMYTHLSFFPCLLTAICLFLFWNVNMPRVTLVTRPFFAAGSAGMMVVAILCYLSFSDCVSPLLLLLILSVWTLLRLWRLVIPRLPLGEGLVEYRAALRDAAPLLFWAVPPVFLFLTAGMQVLAAGIGLEHVCLIADMTREAPLLLSKMSMDIVPLVPLYGMGLAYLVWSALALLVMGIAVMFPAKTPVVEKAKIPSQNVAE